MTESGRQPSQPEDPYGPPPSGAQPQDRQQYGSQPYPGEQYGGQPYGAPPAGPKRNGFGVAALVLGILALLTSLFIVPGLILGVLAVIFGFLGRRRASRGEADNGGLAITGLVLGLLAVVISVVLAIAAGSVLNRIVNTPEGQRLTECLQQANGDQARTQACQDEFERSQG